MLAAEDLEEVDVYEPTSSVFSSLFTEDDKMNVWNDFLNRPEEDQYDILNNNMSLCSNSDDESGSEFEVVDSNDGVVDAAQDGRQGNL